MRDWDIAERSSSQALFHSLIESLPQNVFSKDLEGRFTFANQHYCMTEGRPLADILGKTDFDLHPPELAEKYREDDRRVIETGQIFETVEEHQPIGEEKFYVQVIKTPVYDSKGQATGVLGIFWDITERKRAEEELRRVNRANRVLSECNQAVIRATEEPGLLHKICQLIVEVGGYRLTWVGFAEQDEGQTVRPVAQAGYEAGYLDTANVTWADTERGHGPTGTAVRTGKPSIARNILTDSNYAPWRAEAIKRGYASSIALPLIAEGQTLRPGSGQALGALHIYAVEPDAFDTEEVKLLTELASDLAFGIKALRTRAEHKQAEAELQEAERRFRTLLDNVGLIAVGLDQEGNVAYTNPYLLELSGYTLDEVLGKNWFQTFIPERDRPTVGTVFSKILENGIYPHYENPILTKDGEERLIVWNNTLLLDPNGKQVGTMSIGEDITDRQRMEVALRKSEEKYRLHFENVSDVIYSIDLEFRVLSVSPSVERVLGYKPEELIGKPLQELNLLAAESLEMALSDVRRILAGERVSAAVYEFIVKDGSRRFGEVSGAPLVQDGKVVALVSVARDITERKRAERLLQTLNAASLSMRRALTHEEIFAAVAEELKKLGFSCVVLLTDESQNRLFPKYLGYEAGALKAAEKLVGLKYEEFSIPLKAVDVFTEVVREKETVWVENEKEVLQQMLPEPAKKFTGQIVRMLNIPKAIVAPLIVEDKVIGLLSVQADDLTEDDIPAITAFAHQMAATWHKANLMENLQNNLEELKRTQAQLLQAQKMDAIGQLAGGIVHDFNNLLTPIGGFADLLLWKAPEGSQQEKYLRQIKVAAERAAALTRQLRLFTRQEEGERRSVQLNGVVQETRDLLEHSIPKDITIELHLASELWAVEADLSQISQVLVNLCLNARDAMPGGGTLTLETHNVTLDEEYARILLAARPGRYVRLSVSDTGCGMSPEVQARLFEPFFTTKEPGKGTGLGLAVVYGIVKGHGGFINIYSEEGQGSTFRVYLPAIESAVEEREAEGLAWPTGTETILLVDDEEAVQALGQSILERCGYTVLMAENGLQALEVYQAHQREIGLVVLDVGMPQMGGRECLRRLREMAPQVKVLISTGYTASGLAKELAAEGALGVVEKPFVLRDFAVSVRGVLAGR
jgi:PAS domain S-box-containing protein